LCVCVCVWLEVCQSECAAVPKEEHTKRERKLFKVSSSLPFDCC